MAKIASDFSVLSDLIKHEYAPQWGYCRDNVTVAAAKVRGDLVDATGATPAAVANIVGVVINDVAAGGSAEYLKRGPVGVLKTSVNVGALVAADVYAKLEALGIQVINEYL